MERGAAPSLLPVLRSRQQGELLARLLGDPGLEASLTDLAAQLGIPVSSVHREIDRAQSAGLVTSRKVGNTRLVRANTASPYFAGLADVLVKAFGPPQVLAEALTGIDGIDAAYIYGSWAAAFHDANASAGRPVADIDLLVLGSPDRDKLYAAVSAAEQRLGRPVQVTLRPSGWLNTGRGTFHATVTERPLVEVNPMGEMTPDEEYEFYSRPENMEPQGPARRRRRKTTDPVPVQLPPESPGAGAASVMPDT